MLIDSDWNNRWAIFIQTFLITFHFFRMHAECASVRTMSSKVFQNFDLRCSPAETVSGLTSKRFVSPIGTVDYELTVFCRNISGPTDPIPIVNTCRYVTESHPRNDATMDERDCGSGEYVNGFQGTYEDGYRAISLRCCKVSNIRADSAGRCETVGPETIATVAATGLRDPGLVRSGCPRNVLSSFSIIAGKLTAKFCPLVLNGAKYELYCFPDHKHSVDMMQEESIISPPAETDESVITDSNKSERNQAFSPHLHHLPRVHEVEETQYGKPFLFQCEYGQALSSFKWRSINGTDGYDLLYTFDCDDVTNGTQEAVRRRVTKVVCPNDTVSLSCRKNETVCGIHSAYNSIRCSRRRYAFVCCAGSNWYSSMHDNTTELVVTDTELYHEHEQTAPSTLVAPTTTTAGAINKSVVQGISISVKDNRTTITAIFQLYHYYYEARFRQNITSYEYESVLRTRAR